MDFDMEKLADMVAERLRGAAPAPTTPLQPTPTMVQPPLASPPPIATVISPLPPPLAPAAHPFTVAEHVGIPEGNRKPRLRLPQYLMQPPNLAGIGGQFDLEAAKAVCARPVVEGEVKGVRWIVTAGMWLKRLCELYTDPAKKPHFLGNGGTTF